MIAVMMGRPPALEQLFTEECAAWDEYLEVTRGQNPVRYEEAEPWAWARLCQRLRAIDARRSRILAPASERGKP